MPSVAAMQRMASHQNSLIAWSLNTKFESGRARNSPRIRYVRKLILAKDQVHGDGDPAATYWSGYVRLKRGNVARHISQHVTANRNISTKAAKNMDVSIVA